MEGMRDDVQDGHGAIRRRPTRLLRDERERSGFVQETQLPVYLVRLADQLEIDLLQAAERKLALNEAKYPAERVRGSSKKYSEYE